MSRKKKIVENVVLTGIADRGKAVGRDADGIVYFVPDAVPGDVVNILRLKKKRGVYQGSVTEFVEYSEDRIEPKCKHFGVCGGCKWQNLDYQKQLAHKTQTVHDAMRRIAKIDTSIILPILGSTQIFEYRNKIEYSFSNKRWLTREEIDQGDNIKQSPAVGFHRAGAFEKVVDIDQCHLQENTTNKIRNFFKELAYTQGWDFYDAKARTGFVRSMFLRNSPDGNWMINVVFKHENNGAYKVALDALIKEFPEITSLYYMINDKQNDSVFDLKAHHYYGEKYLAISLGHINYKIGPKSFFQTNSSQAKVLFDQIKNLADLTGEENVYDLYSGIGSIGFYLANQAKQIVGIEEIPEAIEDAKLNAKENNIDNTMFYAGDVKNILTNDFAAKHGKPDLVITDPPRAGMHKELVYMLLRLESPRIIYVSCNPATQARDLQLLNDKYIVEKMQPVDMFPHTHHIENIALLSLRNE